MANTVIVIKNGGVITREKTPEEKAQDIIDYQTATVKEQQKEAEKTRLQAIKDDARTLDIIDKLTNANNTQIDSFVDSANTTQLKTILAGVLKVMAYKLR